MGTKRAIGLIQEDRTYLAQARSKHPELKSDCGALLREILTPSDLKHRTRCAIIFGLEGYRRGFSQIEPLVDDLVKTVEAQSDDPWIGPPEQALLHQLLFAVGLMDTARSHALLERLIRTSSSHLVRASALDAIAFENRHYDFELALPFASEGTQTTEIISALFALQYRYAHEHSQEARRRIAPLLRHPHWLVQDYALRVLGEDPANLDLLLPFLDDPAQGIRETAQDVVRMMKRD